MNVFTLWLSFRSPRAKFTEVLEVFLTLKTLFKISYETSKALRHIKYILFLKIIIEMGRPVSMTFFFQSPQIYGTLGGGGVGWGWGW